MRGCYCALAVCHMLQLDMEALAEACGMVDYIRACQVVLLHDSFQTFSELRRAHSLAGSSALECEPWRRRA